MSGREDVDRLQRMENAITPAARAVSGGGVWPDSVCGGRAGIDRASQWGAAGAAAVAATKAVSPVQNLLSMTDRGAGAVARVSGGFVFTQDGIDVNNLLVRVATGDPARPETTNAFRIRGT